jgi:quercetin dioxygenase-like cupin family protein
LYNKPRIGITIGLLLIVSLSAAIAQSPALDPVRVAPHIYESVLENERVRVLKVTDRTGETPPLHAHPDRVVVFLSPCAWLETGPDGQSSMQSYKLGDVLWADRVTHGGETSRVVQECSLLEIELK